MSDLLIVVFLIGTPAWLIFQYTRARPTLEAKERSVDPLTGALYFAGQEQARNGLSDRKS